MWSNLSDSIANAKDNIQTPGSLIAKIGDAVAPLEEVEEYEYVSGSGSSDEYEEEYYEEEEEDECVEEGGEEGERLVDGDEMESELQTVRQSTESSDNTITLESVENKSSCAMLTLEQKETEIHQLNTIISDMRTKLMESTEHTKEVEEEADELIQENGTLKEKIRKLEDEHKSMKRKIKDLEKDGSKNTGIQIELQLLKEEHARDKSKLDAALESKSSTHAAIAAERDAAKAESLELQQRLSALQADIDIVKSDYARSVTANDNLQRVMEAFQQEREAELELLEEARVSAEEASKASHEVSLQALKDEHEQVISEVQAAAGKAVQNSMQEISDMESKLENTRKENNTLRRSLDEAIHRLQRNQEDVIDRAFMKNILLDWFSKSGKARREVLDVMASALHFTEDEKNKCGIGENFVSISKVAGMVAPPIEKRVIDIEGDNVREQWVSFLMAECGEDSAAPSRSRQTGATTL